MMRFHYEAVDPDGKSVEGTMEETSAHRVTAVLREQGFQVNAVTPVDRPAAPKRTGRIGWQELYLFNEQLHGLVRSGLPLCQGLAALSHDIFSSRLRGVMDDIRRQIEMGNSLEEAFQRHANAFPPVYLAAIRAGERTGNLSEVLESFSHYAERRIEMRHKAQTALAYPLLLIVATFGVCLFMLLKVVPVFANIFSQFGGGLPRLSRDVIGLSTFLGAHLWEVFGVLVGVVVALYIVGEFLARGARYGGLLDVIAWHCPLVRRLFRSDALARFSQSLGLLVSNNVPLSEALRLAGAASGNGIVANAAERMAERVEQGTTLADACREAGIFDSTFCWMVANGEHTGDLSKTFLSLGDAYERRLYASASLATSTLAPAVFVFTGAMVILILFAIYQPMFTLGDAITG